MSDGGGLQGVPGGGSRLAWLGPALSAGALLVLGALLVQSDWQALAAPLGRVRAEYLIVAVALAGAVEVVKTVRWQVLLGAKPRALPRLLGVLCTARLLNALVPLRAGDVWRVAAARQAGQSLALAGGSVVVEKGLDGAALGALAAVALWVVAPAALGAALGGMAVLAVGIAALALAQRGPAAAWARRELASLARWHDWRLAGFVLALTGAGLGLGVLVNLAVLAAVGLPVTLGAGIVMLLAGYAVGLMPAGPGQVGVFELGVAVPLSAIGIDYPTAVVAAAALHLVLLTTLAIGGLTAIAFGRNGWYHTVCPSR